LYGQKTNIVTLHYIVQNILFYIPQKKESHRFGMRVNKLFWRTIPSTKFLL